MLTKEDEARLATIGRNRADDAGFVVRLLDEARADLDHALKARTAYKDACDVALVANERLRAQLSTLTAERDEQAARVAAIINAGKELAIFASFSPHADSTIDAWQDAIRARAGSPANPRRHRCKTVPLTEDHSDIDPDFCDLEQEGQRGVRERVSVLCRPSRLAR